jgi:hypothetical protein
LFDSKAGIEFANKVVVQNKTRNSTVFFIIFDLIIYSQKNWAVKKRWDCINCSVVLGFEEFCPKLFFMRTKKQMQK